MKFLMRVFLGVLCASMFVVAHAAPDRVISKGGATWISGGIGSDSLLRLKAMERDFNLKLVFTLIAGNYLSDVSVSVVDAAGKAMIANVADGPVMLARLPAGKYSVRVVYEGKTQVREITLRGDRLLTEYFRWPGDPATDFALPPEHVREGVK